MDKDQARFVLRSFRPDGADCDDRDFAEALAVAMQDRELGDWLAAERAFDAEFAAAISSVALPESLRQDILRSLAGERGDLPQAEDAIDSAMIGALAAIHPPGTLREEIVAAMERTNQPIRPPLAVWKRLALPLAAAAGVTLALIVTHAGPKAKTTRTAQTGPLPLEVVQTGFIHAFESPLFSLDEQREDHQVLIRHLKSKKLPCPGCLPPGLANVKGIGCRELVIDGRRGSLVCFDEREAGTVHLVIFRREDVAGELPPRDSPSFSRHGHWAAARWEDDRNVFILIGNTEIEKLAALF